MVKAFIVMWFTRLSGGIATIGMETRRVEIRIAVDDYRNSGSQLMPLSKYKGSYLEVQPTWCSARYLQYDIADTIRKETALEFEKNEYSIFTFPIINEDSDKRYLSVFFHSFRITPKIFYSILWNITLFIIAWSWIFVQIFKIVKFIENAQN